MTLNFVYFYEQQSPFMLNTSCYVIFHNYTSKINFSKYIILYITVFCTHIQYAYTEWYFLKRKFRFEATKKWRVFIVQTSYNVHYKSQSIFLCYNYIITIYLLFEKHLIDYIFNRNNFIALNYKYKSQVFN